MRKDHINSAIPVPDMTRTLEALNNGHGITWYNHDYVPTWGLSHSAAPIIQYIEPWYDLDINISEVTYSFFTAIERFIKYLEWS